MRLYIVQYHLVLSVNGQQHACGLELLKTRMNTKVFLKVLYVGLTPSG